MSTEQPVVHVVDDDRATRESLASLLRSAGLEVETFASADEFLARCRASLPGCLVLDVQLPGLSGLDLQQELAKDHVQIPIIFMTGHGDVPTSVRAMKAGALEFFTKPFDDEALITAVRRATARSGRSPHPSAGPSGDPDLVGSSPRMAALLNRMALVARTDSTVLVMGETGTGKELVARSIHAQSPRATRPLVSVNCGAIQPSLIASELFGHEKGSFTGALQQRVGRFELADGGTIFLDEIGELPLDTQVALLRVLQEREFERVGGNRSIRVDVRVIAATNRDLKAAIATGKFRADLFYRLNVFPITIPALRERREDIPLLIEHFLRMHARGDQLRRIAPKTMHLLQSYSWPGNVRELQNLVERWVILGESEDVSIDESWLPEEGVSAGLELLPDDPLPDQPIQLEEHVAALERKLIQRTLSAVDGNRSEAARRLGLSRGALLGRLRKYGPLPN